MFTFNKDVTATNCEPGVTRKILCYSDDLMMCEIHFEKVLRAISIATSICRLLMLLREALNSLSVMKLKSLIRATAYTCLLA